MGSGRPAKSKPAKEAKWVAHYRLSKTEEVEGETVYQAVIDGKDMNVPTEDIQFVIMAKTLGEAKTKAEKRIEGTEDYSLFTIRHPEKGELEG
jgi:hypothetical protein